MVIGQKKKERSLQDYGDHGEDQQKAFKIGLSPLSQDQTTTLILYCIGKFGISSSYVVLPLMASELYPTVVRGIGLGLSSTAGMIGPVIIPLINYLGTEILVLPLIIMGVFLVFGGFSALLLPETLHQHLPQTIEEGESFGQNMSFQDYLNCCPRRRLNLQTQEIPQTNEEVEKLTEFKEKFQPTLCEDIVEESNYSSLRRNSFKIAQIEAISFEEQGRSHSMNNGSRDQTNKKTKKSKKSMDNGSGDQTKKKTKKSKKSGCMESYFKNGHELLLQTPKRVTVI
ncbi:Carcinine transporter [Armadillidium vulgare]|nr:Carcinine transporter [Armadillidium vulgare]